MDGSYHGDNNVPGMMDIVIPLHEELERGASTAKEEEFQVSHGSIFFLPCTLLPINSEALRYEAWLGILMTPP